MSVVSKPKPLPPPSATVCGDPLGPYEDGFSIRTLLGALFVAFVMMPASIYMGLVVGATLGSAAEWVTIILFAELARRSFVRLKRQEIYILFYVASSIAAIQLVQIMLAGGPFAGLIWNQYLLQSPQTSTLADKIPDWVIPKLSSPGILGRNLAYKDWWWSQSMGLLSPLLLVFISYLLGRLSWYGLGYLIFRLTSDREKLPFPLAPIAAEGATALAEATNQEKTDTGRFVRTPSWRWNVFSAGACMGLIFGAVYVLFPMVTSQVIGKPLMILPIPFLDLTKNVENVLPASLIGISFDAGLFLAGMILPFNLVMGIVVAVLVTSVFGNPILQHFGVFAHWRPGNGLLVNQMILNFDFYISVALGLALAVLLFGFGTTIKSFWRRSKSGRKSAREDAPPPTAEAAFRRPSKDRGDYPLWVAIALFVGSALGFCWVCHVLVPGFPIWIVLFFGFIWSPIHSYVSGRLIGITGLPLATPYLRESAFLLSGYRNLDIWFAPIPLLDMGAAAQKFREMELTRTRFTSMIKAEFVMFPIIFLSSFLFWWFFWRLNQIPSHVFPFASRIWPVAARQAYLILTANSSDSSLLLQAIKPNVIFGTLGVGVALYAALSAVGIPAAFFYGIIMGVGQPSLGTVPMLVGALLGRYYFRRKFGEERWLRYVPVLAAGFFCGSGLAAMIGVAIALVGSSTTNLPF